MTSNQLSLTDVLNLLSPISTSSPSLSLSPDSGGFSSNAIAELIRKRQNRLESEKKAKNGGKTSDSVLSENGSPPKMIKIDETIFTPPLTTTTTNSDSLSNDTTESSNAFTDSSFLSFCSNSSSPWSQLSSSDTSSSPSPSQTPSSNFDLAISKKSIGDEFTVVCGRLSLLNSQKYVVTVGEMARRVFGREEFGFSLLGGLLRRAKTPHSTNALKADLHAVGIDIERGRRRPCRLTLFGGLLEGEAVQLGKDFNALLSSTFPSQIIAQYLANEKAATTKLEKERLKKVEQLKAAQNCLNEFLNFINQDASPIQDSYPLPSLPDSIQNNLTNFSIMTHGFGMFAVKSVLEMYAHNLDAQILALS